MEDFNFMIAQFDLLWFNHRNRVESTTPSSCYLTTTTFSSVSRPLSITSPIKGCVLFPTSPYSTSPTPTSPTPTSPSLASPSSTSPSPPQSTNSPIIHLTGNMYLNLILDLFKYNIRLTQKVI